MLGINALNRVLLFVFGLAAAAAGAICLLVATNVLGTETLAPSGWFREQFTLLDQLSGDGERIAFLAGGVAIGFGLLLALFEAIPSSHEKRFVSVTDPNGNTVLLPPESIRQLVEQAALSVAGIVRANAVVREANGDGVLIEANALLAPDAHVVQKSNELNDKIRGEMANRVGVKVAGLRLNLELARADDREGTHRGPFHWGDRREKISPSR
jgi:hypothetical protein